MDKAEKGREHGHVLLYTTSRRSFVAFVETTQVFEYQVRLLKG